MPYSENNIEDWDFHHCGHADPEYDVEADLFFGTHFTTALAVDSIRLNVIKAFLDKGFATLDDDRQHVRLISDGAAVMRGWKSGTSRLTRDGRFERKVVEALLREHRKYGRLRVTILPPLPGFANQGDDDDAGEDGLVPVDIEARDKAFYDFVNAVGGYEPLVALVQEHAANAGVAIANDGVMLMIEGWHQYGVVRSMSIGEYLDEAWQDLDEEPPFELEDDDDGHPYTPQDGLSPAAKQPSSREPRNEIERQAARSRPPRVGFLRSRVRGYRAVVQVERYRAAAEALKVEDPDTFWQVIGQADGSEAEAAARRDPVVYVALFLAAADDAGFGTDRGSG